MDNVAEMRKFLLEERMKEDEYHARRNGWRTSTTIPSRKEYEEEQDLDTTNGMMTEGGSSKELKEHIDRLVEEMWMMDINGRDMDGTSTSKRTRRGGKKIETNVGGMQPEDGQSTDGGAWLRRGSFGARRTILTGRPSLTMLS